MADLSPCISIVTETLNATPVEALVSCQRYHCIPKCQVDFVSKWRDVRQKWLLLCCVLGFVIIHCHIVYWFHSTIFLVKYCVIGNITENGILSDKIQPTSLRTEWAHLTKNIRWMRNVPNIIRTITLHVQLPAYAIVPSPSRYTI